MTQTGKDKPQNDRIEGEGSYTGAKQYNEATREFVEDGKVKQAARKAAPGSEKEAQEMEAAEREGRSHAKDEDPALRKKDDGMQQ